MLSLMEVSYSVNSSKVGTPANHGLKQSSRNLDQSGGNVMLFGLVLVSRNLYQSGGNVMLFGLVLVSRNLYQSGVIYIYIYNGSRR